MTPCARRLLAAMPGLKERAKTLIELIDGAYYIHAGAPSRARRQGEGTARALRASRRSPKVAAELEKLREEWSAPALEAAVRGFADREGLKLGQAAQPLRAALTGRATSPGLFDVMAVLGREECLARIKDACQTGMRAPDR